MGTQETGFWGLKTKFIIRHSYQSRGTSAISIFPAAMSEKSGGTPFLHILDLKIAKRGFLQIFQKVRYLRSLS